jgi:2'-5' RNA ligase
MARDRSKREGGKSRRLFIGIEIPDTMRGEVWEAFAPVREAFPRAKWVPPQNYHATLKFLGSVWPRLFESVEAGCDRAAVGASPFDVRLVDAGSFPQGKKAAVIWAGLADPEDGCRRLASRVEEELGSEFPRESRPFSAHLTVARSRPPLDLGEALSSVTVASEPWTVREIVVFESHLGRPAPRYEVLLRLPVSYA